MLAEQFNFVQSSRFRRGTIDIGLWQEVQIPTNGATITVGAIRQNEDRLRTGESFS